MPVTPLDDEDVFKGRRCATCRYENDWPHNIVCHDCRHGQVQHTNWEQKDG